MELHKPGSIAQENLFTSDRIRHLFSHARRLGISAGLCDADVEDLVQSTLLKSLRVHNTFSDENALYGYLYQVLKNTFIDHLRRRDRRFDDFDLVQDLPSKRAEPFRQFLSAEVMDAVDDVLQVIDPHQIMSFFLYDELSYQEIADITGLTLGQVRGKIFQLRRKLRATLLRRGLVGA